MFTLDLQKFNEGVHFKLSENLTHNKESKT